MSSIVENSPIGEDASLPKIVEAIDLSLLSPQQQNWVRRVLERYAEEHSTFEDEGGAESLLPHADYDKLTPDKPIAEILAMYTDIEG